MTHKEALSMLLRLFEKDDEGVFMFRWYSDAEIEAKVKKAQDALLKEE